MLFAALEFHDYLVIGVLIAIFAGGTSLVSRRSAASAAAGERLRRMEDKLNLLLSHHGIAYVPSVKERWQRLADSNERAEAAAAYIEEFGVGQQEADEVVEQYLADRSKLFLK